MQSTTCTTVKQEQQTQKAISHSTVTVKCWVSNRHLCACTWHLNTHTSQCDMRCWCVGLTTDSKKYRKYSRKSTCPLVNIILLTGLKCVVNTDFCHMNTSVWDKVQLEWWKVEVRYKLKYTFTMAHSRNRSPTKPSNEYCFQSCSNMAMNESQTLETQANPETVAFLKCSQEIWT